MNEIVAVSVALVLGTLLLFAGVFIYAFIVIGFFKFFGLMAKERFYYEVLRLTVFRNKVGEGDIYRVGDEITFVTKNTKDIKRVTRWAKTYYAAEEALVEMERKVDSLT